MEKTFAITLSLYSLELQKPVSLPMTASTFCLHKYKCIIGYQCSVIHNWSAPTCCFSWPSFDANEQSRASWNGEQLVVSCVHTCFLLNFLILDNDQWYSFNPLATNATLVTLVLKNEITYYEITHSWHIKL